MAGEMLGIVITKYANFDHISGVIKAAQAAGHRVSVFMTDEGVKFTTDEKFKQLIGEKNVDISCCDHSCELLHIADKTNGITYGSQFNHATLHHDSKRVLVF